MLHLYDSKINGTVKIKKYLWETSVWVGGFEQSGPLVKAVWQKALASFWPESRISSVLILGLGCGIAAKLISKKFPNALITGVEIDPVMIDVGKKYFDLGKIKRLKIICVDARIFLKNNKTKFDLVIDDLYLGGKATAVSIKKLGKIVLKNNLDTKTLQNTVSVLKLTG